jgi:hypothetical protein
VEAWTTADVEALIAAAESIEVAAWAVRELLVGLLVVGCLTLGWFMGGTMAPSAREMSWGK